MEEALERCSSSRKTPGGGKNPEILTADPRNYGWTLEVSTLFRLKFGALFCGESKIIDFGKFVVQLKKF